MARRDVIHQLAEATVDIGPLAVPLALQEQLTSVCAAARVAFGAVGVSVAVARDDALHYVAAAGGGDIVGTVVDGGRGLGSYVLMSGQALIVDQPANDPRFARDVAERSGYLPESMLVVPVSGSTGDPIGVLTVLDRAAGAADALALASAFAEVVAPLLAALDETNRGARLLLAAVLEAARSSDPSLAEALGRTLTRLPDEDVDLAAIATALARLRGTDGVTRKRALAAIDAVVELATARRR